MTLQTTSRSSSKKVISVDILVFANHYCLSRGTRTPELAVQTLRSFGQGLCLQQVLIFLCKMGGMYTYDWSEQISTNLCCTYFGANVKYLEHQPAPRSHPHIYLLCVCCCVLQPADSNGTGIETEGAPAPNTKNNNNKLYCCYTTIIYILNISSHCYLLLYYYYCCLFVVVARTVVYGSTTYLPKTIQCN